MLLKKIKLSNFKSFDEVEIELNDFNVLVGANASGKSNFLQALKFLKDIQEFGLENAVSLQGGMEYLGNLYSAKDKIRLSFDIESEEMSKSYKLLIKAPYYVVIEKIYYVIELGIKKGKPVLMNEKITIQAIIHDFDHKVTHKRFNSDKKDTITITNQDGRVKILSKKLGQVEKLYSNSLETSQEAFFSFLSNYQNLGNESTGTSVLEIYNILFLLLSDLRIYEFNLKLAKRAIPIVGKVELEDNGENLAILLRQILGDTDSKRKFINIISGLLPFVKDVGIEKFYDKSLLFKIKESFKEKEMPSFLLSDGTIAITLMVTALFFGNKRLIAFEEPEQGIHPALIAKLMQLFYEASQDKQIIITTHNPEVVKHTQLKDLLLVSRREDGSSTITRPDNSQTVHTFLDNELGIDELFTQNLLDV